MMDLCCLAMTYFKVTNFLNHSMSMYFQPANKYLLVLGTYLDETFLRYIH